jgi:spore coat protein U-like protein
MQLIIPKQEKAMKLATMMLLSAVVVFLSLGAFAASDVTANLSVSANVLNVCTVQAGSLDFGNYDPASSTANDATGSFDVQCAAGGTASIKLDQGLNPDTGGTLASPLRRLKHGTADYLSYALFSDALRETPWEGETGVGYEGTGDSDTRTVYERIAASQTAAIGTYNDTVTITVTY